jgi:hypothetical protein
MSDALRDFFEFRWLSGLDLSWATGLVVAVYVVLLAYGVTRSSDFIFEGAPDRRRFRDLRLWLVPIVLAQIALYIWLR